MKPCNVSLNSSSSTKPSSIDFKNESSMAISLSLLLYFESAKNCFTSLISSTISVPYFSLYLFILSFIQNDFESLNVSNRSIILFVWGIVPSSYFNASQFSVSKRANDLSPTTTKLAVFKDPRKKLPSLNSSKF